MLTWLFEEIAHWKKAEGYTDTTSPYTDTRPVKTAGQAEWRDYRACWWDGDTASMAFGPVVRVLVNG
jgi:hypothetical protein